MRIEYPGFIISKQGIPPNPKKTKVLADKEIFKNEKELRFFLGAAIYYRKHITNYSKIASILYEATKNFIWNDHHTTAFNNLKTAIINACTLSLPDSIALYAIMIDASIQGLGAALIQDNKPIAFTSRTLKKSEVMYAPVQLEAIGLVYALKQLTPYIFGKRTTILTDQSSLLSLMTKRDVSNILDRHKTYIMGFDLDIKYIKGTDNSVADYLSRKIFSIDITSTTANFTDAFPKLTNYLQLPYVVDNFKKYLSDKERELYPEGTISSRGKLRFFVHQKLRFMLLTVWYEHPLLGNHSGFDKGAPKIKDVFLLPNMDTDIKRV
uniref:RT_RNaseH_2 domain-containing protein n=1 Tax=Strongyloides papillosus TaxID=174720 RepID=A0A0N5BQ41_STREA